MQFESILKMDFYKLYRNKAMRIIILIPIIGIFSLVKRIGYAPNVFLEYLKITAFILAYTMAPIIFTTIILASKDEEIFSIININLPAYIISKIVNLVPIALYSLIITLLPYYFLGQKNNVEMSTIIYYMKFVLVYYSIYLAAYASVGYFLGAILGNVLKGAFSFMLGTIFIYFSAGVERVAVKTLTLANINGYTTTNILRFDTYTIKIFQSFLLMSITFILIFFMLIIIRQRKKMAIVLVIPIILVGYFASMFFSSLESKKSVRIETHENLRFDMWATVENTQEQIVEKTKKIPTVVNSIDDEGFIINKYKMNIELEEELKNVAEIDITLTDKSKKEIKFQFYGNSSILSIKVNEEDVNYTMDSSTLYIDLDSVDLKDNNDLKIEMEYSAYIYTYRDVLGYHYVSKRGAFLDTNLAWYPMVDNGKNKDFDVLINTDNERLFSNLDVAKNSNGYELSGEHPNIILLSGDKSITSITKNGVEYYGLDVVINNEKSMEFYGRILSMYDEIEKSEDELMKRNFRFYNRGDVRKFFITDTSLTGPEQVGNSINF